ncbi:MAG: 2-C-methyl-D-erythritol 4-phosphate cytidylyltransferase, partial [Dokdonella sp.]|uniref:IspD/TarI family cytidylyltransferase n=1 Tax=Dokdonella sp. TaxID=2291710 RepID=UPI003BB22451
VDLIDALVSARDAGIVVTDEAMAMERAGFRPLLVEGSEDNIKITTGADRVFAEYLFEQESESASREQAKSKTGN